MFSLFVLGGWKSSDSEGNGFQLFGLSPHGEIDRPGAAISRDSLFDKLGKIEREIMKVCLRRYPFLCLSFSAIYKREGSERRNFFFFNANFYERYKQIIGFEIEYTTRII